MKDAMLAFCDEAYAKARFRDRDGKIVAAGIRRAREAIAAAAPGADLAALKKAIEDEKARVRGGPDDDENGWLLGGMTTVLNELERRIGK
jgi:hypothetical protein